MPVEIRELVIQAKLKEGLDSAVGSDQKHSLPPQQKGKLGGEATLSAEELKEMVEQIVKQILAERNLR